MYPNTKTNKNPRSGKVCEHKHTSYLFLLALLFMTGFVLALSTQQSLAQWVRPGPAAESIGLIGAVLGTPPNTAAVITKPTNGQRFQESPVEVAGTCPQNTLVEIFKNDIFAGSVVCSADGTFSLDVDLLIGSNILTARVFDALNQEGPVSPAVTVFYDAIPPQGSPLSNLSFGGSQLIINTDAIIRGAFPNKELSMPITIIGGRAPYAVNVQWGDANNTVISRPDNATFRVPHTYKRAGTFQISIQATDADNRVAFLTVASIVNGQPDPVVVGSGEQSKNTFGQIMLLWPAYLAALAIVISFWLGEKREEHLLLSHGLLAR